MKEKPLFTIKDTNSNTGVQINTDDVQKPKSNLFDDIKMMFERPDKFEQLSNHEKGKNFFMINRFLSIKFPLQAQLFNNTNINAGEAVQIWSDILSPIYSTTPSFIWNGLKKTKKQKKSKKLHTFNMSTIEFYANLHDLSISEVEKCIEYIGEPFSNMLGDIEIMMSKKLEKEKK